MEAVRSACEQWSRDVGDRWNRFWFSPTAPESLAAVRIVAGVAVLYLLLSFLPDLITWFGPSGLMPTNAVQRTASATAPGLPSDGSPVYRWSYFYLVDSPPALWTLHGLAMVIALAFTFGWATRITSVLTLVVVLSYIHRSPATAGQFEALLAPLLFYLCLAPCGRCWSIDRWRAVRRGNSPAGASVAANIAIRLVQVHLSFFYLTLAFTKLGGEVWWAGEAVWWLVARTDTRLVDWSFLHGYPVLINLWSHFIVAFELLFGLLIWNRYGRPVLLMLSVVHWFMLVLVTGLPAYGALVCLMGVAFIPSTTLSNAAAAVFGRSSPAVP